MKKVILVAGGAGFLGVNLTKRLIEEGHRVLCVDNLYTGHLENIAQFQNNENFSFIEYDICNVLKIDERLDEIYNLACPASPKYYQKDAIQTIKTSIFGSINLLELAKKNKCKILQASTSEVYGNPLVSPQKEDYWGNVNPLGIRSCYDEGKRGAESIFMNYYLQYGVEVKIIRIFNTYGPGMSPQDGRVVSNFIIQILKNEPITVYGNGEQTRSFCYVDDLIDGMIKMMSTSSDITGPVNLGNPEEITVKIFAEKLLSLSNSESKVEYLSLPEDDPLKRCPDISYANEILNWQPKISLEEGLERTIKYFKTML